MFEFGFYNAKDLDRVYDANQWGRIFDGLIADGIYESIGDRFAVSETGVEDAPNQVIVGSGRAWCSHTWTYNSAPTVVILNEPDPTLKRIDTVVLRVDHRNRTNSLAVLTGIPAADPVAPVYSRDGIVDEYPLADISRPVLTDSKSRVITEKDIKSRIGMDCTPYVVGIIENVSCEPLIKEWKVEWEEFFENSFTEWSTLLEASSLQWSQSLASWRSEFYSWFETLEDALEPDVAAKLMAFMLRIDAAFKLLEESHYISSDLLDWEGETILDTGMAHVQGDTYFADPSEMGGGGGGGGSYNLTEDDYRKITDRMYPVGTILPFFNGTNPNIQFPGTTWSKIQGRFLYASDSSITAGKTGGVSTVKLGVGNLPAHAHTQRGFYNCGREQSGWGLARSTGFGNRVFVTRGATDIALNGATTLTTANTGSGTAFSIMPPYMSVNMWKRDA